MVKDGYRYVGWAKHMTKHRVLKHTYMLNTQRYSNMRVAKHVCMFHLSR